MERLLTAALTLLAKLHLWRFRPTIVGITGNSGKTGTRTATAAVLATRYRVRTPAANMNTPLGMATTIIGDFDGAYSRMGGTPMFWSGVLVRALWGWLAPARGYPEVLVLEYGADHPGDIKRLATRFRPSIAVVTSVGDVPVHVEYFASAREVAAEKAQLVKALPVDGHAVLNADDLSVLEMRHASPAPDTTFGGVVGADLQYEEVRVRTDSRGKPVGVAFNLKVGNAVMPVAVNGVIGWGAAAACAAAAAVGRIMGIGLADAVEALAGMRPVAGRMRILAGIKDSIIVDDTYNASPAAVHLAIDTVRGLFGRKLLVLGDMLELGKHFVSAHTAVGTMAAAVADELVCVGESAGLIAEAAANQMQPQRIHRFPDSRSAAPAVQKLMRQGDVVLVKGSQGIRMERIVSEILAEPKRAHELLVRQSIRWLEK